MRLFSNFFMIMFLLTIAGCGFKVFPEFKVSGIDITEEKILISFSSRPDRNSIMDALSFYCDSKIVAGDFSFSGNNAAFYPKETIKNGHDYILSISAEAEDVNGLSLSQKYTHKFSTKTDFSSPEILSVEPCDEEVIDGEVSELKIIFSESINEKSFLDSFSIKPNCEYIIRWNDDKSEATVCFSKPLILSTRYTVNISTQLHDLDNNPLLNPYVLTFTNGTDKTAPFYEVYEICDDNINRKLSTNLLNSGFRTNSKLRIVFDEEMNTDNISSNISIKPDIMMSIEVDKKSKKKADIVFTESPDWNQNEYILTISKGLKDISANETQEEKEYRFRFDHESDRPVAFIKGILELSENEYFSIDEETSFSPLVFPVEKFPTTGEIVKDVSVWYVFQISSNADSLNLISAMDDVFRVSATNSCVSASFSSVRILNDSEVKNEKFANDSAVYAKIQKVSEKGGKLAAVMFSLQIENTDYYGQISFNIGKELKDNLDNSLAEDIVLKYNKQ